MKSGTGPHLLDLRDHSLNRTFPLFGAFIGPLNDLTYTYDAGLTMPDQVAEGYPMGCTGYTQTDIKGSEDKAVYNPAYTYIKTCLMDNVAPGSGCNIRTSKKSLRVYGAQIQGDTEEHAIFHRGLPYFNVDRAPSRDWFDSFRLALRNSKRSISVGTIWFSEWQQVNSTGILTEHFIYNGNVSAYPWHNYAIVGETVITGIPYFIVKSWQGKNYGDHGLVYMNREAFNKAFDIYGTIGFVDADASGNDVQLIVADLQQTVLVYLNRLLAMIGVQKTIHA